MRIMEVCGTHTMTLHRSGLKPLLREAGVVMVSGPGCPVCITPDYYHEAIIDLVTSRKNILVGTFGDMTRVPTARGSLQTTVPAPGSEIRIVYSPEEALELAVKNPEKEVIFLEPGSKPPFRPSPSPSNGLPLRTLRISPCWPPCG